MEWIRISKNKLKIMLNAEDARRYALDCETADYADVMTREAFREILTDVRAETGFDAAEDKIYIQMYPSKEGGCELFVTKMGLMIAEPHCTPKQVATPCEKVKKSPVMRRRQCAFTFSELADLLALCKRLSPTFHGESEVWQDEYAAWWLLLTDRGDPLTLREDFHFALEYGTGAKAAETRIMLGEHGKLICKGNAVAVLGQL